MIYAYMCVCSPTKSILSSMKNLRRGSKTVCPCLNIGRTTNNTLKHACSSASLAAAFSVSLRNTACIITLSNRLEYFPLGILILSRMNKHEQNLKPPPSSSNYSNDAESHCRDVDHKEKYKTSMNLLDEWPRLARPRPTESEFEQAVQAPKSSTIPLPNPDPVINTWLAPQLHTLKCNQSHLH